jgi:anthranilate synthase component I
MLFTTASRTTALPSREAVHTYFTQGDHVPVYRTLLADLETPVSVYLKLAQAGQPSFLLESVEGGEHVGRYSFLGVNPKGVISVADRTVTRTIGGVTQTRPLADGEDPLHAVQAEFERVKPVQVAGLPRFIGGAVGFLAYDIVRYFERLPATASTVLKVPDAAFMLPDTLVIFDHVKKQLIVLANAHNTGDPDAAYDDALARIDALVAALARPLPSQPPLPPPLDHAPQSNITQEKFEQNVRDAKEYIAAGDAFQVVLSQRFSKRTSAAPFTVYRTLRALNPSPYMFYLRFSDDFVLLGASPEVLVRLEDGKAMVRPIAGTRPRGADEAQDLAYEHELMHDPKERAEHVMLVDLGRNDLGRVCEYGSVEVEKMMYIERYSHVMHIVSQVKGVLNKRMDAFQLLRAAFPAGTLSGAPKVRAMQIIEALEGVRRGTYGGAVGYFSFDGSMDMCITIRSVLMLGEGESAMQAYVQAGAGIVADSDPTAEYHECLNKARAVLNAIHTAEHGLG